MGRKIEVKFKKSDWLPVNVVAVKRTDTFEIAFFCTNCKKEITRINDLQVMEMDYENLIRGLKLSEHKCKEEKDEEP
jgi:hypothetical protein